MILKIETVKNWHVRIRVLNVKNWDKKKEVHDCELLFSVD